MEGVLKFQSKVSNESGDEDRIETEKLKIEC